MRTPIKHVQGRETLRGDPKEAARLGDILRIGSEREVDEAVQGVHRLHPYPGRMHPLWARRILEDLPKDVSVLDPFCGGGTVLVEARRLGLHARGSDINPIAVRLARLKCIPHATEDDIRREADRCVANCLDRRSTQFSALAGDDRGKAYPRHVLAGLISLRDEIEKTRDDRVRELLLFCLSPMLDKFGPDRDGVVPRVPRTAVRDNFAERVLSWLEVFKDLDQFRWVEAEQADARWLPWKPGTSGAVVTSPPYPGVLDYAERQAWRMAWLGGLDHLQETSKREIGRRNTPALWTEDMERSLRQLCRTTRPGSPFYMVIADGVMQGKVVRVDKEISDLCEQLPLETVAIASQERPHFHRPSADAFRDRPRLEHLMLLRRTEGSAKMEGNEDAAAEPKKRRRRPDSR